MWYIFPKSKKTILENQRVMRLKAASWVNIQSTVSQVPMDFILFIAVSIFRVAVSRHFRTVKPESEQTFIIF